jgi:hypothetical protein
MDAFEEFAVRLAGPRSADEVRAYWRRLAPVSDELKPFDPSQTVALPEPARRWLDHVIAAGAPLARAVALRMHGQLRVKRWLPFEAVQLQAPPHGYLWVARAGRGPLSIRGFDCYSSSAGRLRWRLFGRLPLIDLSGADVDRSAAARVALDAFTVPTSWLDPAISWQPGADPDTVTARWPIDGRTLCPQLRIGPDGALLSMSLPRWAAPNGRAWAEYPCGGTVERELSFGGITIPTRLRAGYFFGTPGWRTGEFFRATITDAVFS